MTWKKLPLPNQLKADLKAGIPLTEAELAVLRSLLLMTFHSTPIPELFHCCERLERENRLLTNEEIVRCYIGKKSERYPPGDMDPEKAIIIGGSEPDCPIALDYRTSPPRVICLGSDNDQDCWFTLADSYEQLRARLKQ